jgi:hypothetical protein
MTGSAASARSLYVYAITQRRDDAPPQRAGLDGAPLEVVAHRELAAVVSAHDRARIDPSEAALWEHEAVCEALLAAGAVLPAKFGLMFSDEGKLLAELAARYEELAAALQRVSGRVELGVRVLRRGAPDSETSAPRGGTGTDYLTARLAESREAKELADAVHGTLAELAVDSRRDVLLTPSFLLSAAYLVDRDRTNAFVERIEALDQEHAEARILCTGPWPPYNFVTGATPGE